MPTKDQITDALLEHKRVDLAAESLGIGLRRMYRFMERYGVTLKGVLSWPSMPKSGSSDTPAPVEEAEPQLSEAEVCELMRRFNLSREVILHDCGDDRECPMCRQMALAYHRLYGCPGASCPLQHKLVSTGGAARPRWSKLALSYGPRRSPWEK